MGVGVQNNGFKALRVLHGVSFPTIQAARTANVPKIKDFYIGFAIAGTNGEHTGIRNYYVRYFSKQVSSRDEASHLYSVLDREVSRIERGEITSGQKILSRNNLFDDLPIPGRGKSRGEGQKARYIVSNPGERAAEREAKVKLILLEKWPAPRFVIEDCTSSAGLDFKVWEGSNLVAKVDVKPSPTITSRQLKEARKDSTPYWLVGTNFKLPITKNVVLVPLSYKVYAE